MLSLTQKFKARWLRCDYVAIAEALRTNVHVRRAQFRCGAMYCREILGDTGYGRGDWLRLLPDGEVSGTADLEWFPLTSFAQQFYDSGAVRAAITGEDAPEMFSPSPGIDLSAIKTQPIYAGALNAATARQKRAR